VKFPTGGMRRRREPASAFRKEGSSRSGARPEPTVIVRMKENECADVPEGTLDARVIALGEVSFTRKEITMTHPRFAFVKANWHADIVGKALKGFMEIIPSEQIDVFDVPGAFELPLLARDLATSGKYAAVVAAALVVDGGIYRHDLVASAVVNGLMRAGLDSGVPVLSVSLTNTPSLS
jgi:6,7-dimethyl-8-ribityllumazine synthase